MSIFSQTLADPSTLANLTDTQWDDLMRFSRFAKMMATLNSLTEEQGITNALPPEAITLLRGAQVRMDYMQLKARFELKQIERSFADKTMPIILLKGAAYLYSGLPPAKGRLLSDVDLLVPREDLEDVEKHFEICGWKADKDITEYDEHYYRQWSHEIPPIKHPFRAVEIDIHHNIIMPTSRIKLDANKLIEKAVAIPGSRFHVLCPTDMVLHSASHLLFNDELRGGLRDIWDMKLLCEHFAQEGDFYNDLIDRANELGLQKPLYYALTALEEILNLKIPQSAQKAYKEFAPNPVIKTLMNALIRNTLVPEDVDNLGQSLSQQLLYIRSHWVRMPPLMLAKHLFTKWYRQRSQNEAD